MSVENPDFQKDDQKEEKIDVGGEILSPNELPADLTNAFIFMTDIFYFIDNSEDSGFDEGYVRNRIKKAKTFDEYYRKLYAEEPEKLEEIKEFFSPELVADFDNKIMKLRSLADADKLDIEEVRHVIDDELTPLTRGSKYN